MTPIHNGKIERYQVTIIRLSVLQGSYPIFALSQSAPESDSHLQRMLAGQAL